MAKSKKEKEQNLSLFQRFSKKVRIVVVNAESFEEKRHFTLSPLNAAVLISFFTILITISTYLLIAYTPLKQWVPGMPSHSEELILRKIDMENIQYLEKVKHQSNIENLYYQNLITILNDELPADPTSQDSAYNRDSTNYAMMDFSTSEKDSLLRVKIDLREKYELHNKEGSR